MIASNILISVIFISFLCFCGTHKILVVSHVPIKSHAVLNHILVKLLLEAGHEYSISAASRCLSDSYMHKYGRIGLFVAHDNHKGISDLINSKITQIAIMPINRTIPNLRQIDVSYNKHYFRDHGLKLYSEISKKIFTVTMQHKDVQELLRDTKQEFHLVIAEWMFNDMGMGLAALYDCPMIWFSPLESIWEILRQIDETAARYTSNSVSESSYSVNNLMRHVHMNSMDNEAYDIIFTPLMALRGKSLPTYTEIMHLCSMVFVYSPVLLDDKSKWPEKFKPVGGYHISPKLKPLPENLQNIMDNAKHGVIYFSLGSHLDSTILPDIVNKNLLEMFSKLKQTIVWKHTSELSILPNNVYVTKWAPQQSILSHPRCVLFITQGGILSMTEAIYYAVPVIGIPIFDDQFLNVQKAVDSGIGKTVQVSPKMVTEIKNAIEEIIHDSSYRENVKEQSSIYHNRSVSPRVEVVYWVNHVIRKGVLKFKPDTIFNELPIHMAVIVITVLIALKYIFRRSI